jgi:adenylyl-sulfate kinase
MTSASPARVPERRSRGAILWFTGLSGSGKSTLSQLLSRELGELGLQTYVLDGDKVRTGLNRDLGFSHADRTENIRRIAEVARLMADAGVIVIVAFISPYRDDRLRAREIAQTGGFPFLEIYLATPLEVCESRDPKGLYRRARAGEIQDFTGISAPYEPPLEPEILIETHRETREVSIARVIERLQSHLEI